MQRNLIRELELYEIELHSRSKKNICLPKGEGTFDLTRVNRWFKKFHWGCKNLDDLARSDFDRFDLV